MKTETYNLIAGFLWYAMEKCRHREDAEDLIQDVAVNIWKKNEMFEALPANEKTAYIRRSIHNAYVDMVRNKCSGKRDGRFNLLPTKSNPDVFAKMELKELKKKAKGNRLCDTLFLFAEGYKNIEIAKMEGEKLTTILGRCRYARKFLKS